MGIFKADLFRAFLVGFGVTAAVLGIQMVPALV